VGARLVVGGIIIIGSSLAGARHGGGVALNGALGALALGGSVDGIGSGIINASRRRSKRSAARHQRKNRRQRIFIAAASAASRRSVSGIIAAIMASAHQRNGGAQRIIGGARHRS